MKKIQLPDFANCSANLACSILRYFGAEETGNPTLAVADNLLSKTYKNVVLLILDGMGSRIVKNNLKADGFFRTHLAGNYSSVFPPTTVAATVALDTGLYPAQTGWLGWNCYIKEIDKTISMFRNTDENGEPAAEYDVATRFRPYKSVIDRINEVGVSGHKVSPFLKPYPKTFQDACGMISELCKREGQQYVVGYWYEPDGIMHHTGAYSRKAKKKLCQIEEQVQVLAEELEDTLLLVTADHGHLNCKGASMEEHPELTECLKRIPSIEPRAINFFVKEGLEMQFEKAFIKEFGNDFALLKREEIIEKKLFGPGKEHEHFRDMLGEYIAVGVSNLALFNKTEDMERFVSMHAGLTADEMNIPLIAVEK